MANFEVGKYYKCKSLMGLVPTFVSTATGAETSLFGYMEKPVLIKNNKYYRFRDGLLTFKVGSNYFCSSENPLILEGDVDIPVDIPSAKVMSASKMFAQLTKDFDCGLPPGIVRALCTEMSWNLEHQWDTTADGLRELLLKKLNDFLHPYEGSTIGASSFQKSKTLFVSALLQQDDFILNRVDVRLLPSDCYIVWEKGHSPYVRVSDTLTLKEWYVQVVTGHEDYKDLLNR